MSEYVNHNLNEKTSFAILRLLFISENPMTISAKILSIAALVTLLGAGCSNPASPQLQVKTAETDTTITVTTTPDVAAPLTDEGLKLTAAPLGNNEVKFTWSVPENLTSKDGYRIVRGPTENPTYPGNFWFHQAPGSSERIWINLPTSTQHFRICRFENNTCTAYSNTVVVDAK